jgi:hypothetical protein
MVAWLLEILIGQSNAMMMLRGTCNSHYGNGAQAMGASYLLAYVKSNGPKVNIAGAPFPYLWEEYQHTTTLPYQRHKNDESDINVL